MVKLKYMYKSFTFYHSNISTILYILSQWHIHNLVHFITVTYPQSCTFYHSDISTIVYILSQWHIHNLVNFISDISTILYNLSQWHIHNLVHFITVTYPKYCTSYHSDISTILCNLSQWHIHNLDLSNNVHLKNYYLVDTSLFFSYHRCNATYS